MATGQARTEVSPQSHPALTLQLLCYLFAAFSRAKHGPGGGEGTNIDASNSKHNQPELLSTLPTPTSTTDNYWFKALFGPHQRSLRKGTYPKSPHAIF